MPSGPLEHPQEPVNKSTDRFGKREPHFCALSYLWQRREIWLRAAVVVQLHGLLRDALKRINLENYNWWCCYTRRITLVKVFRQICFNRERQPECLYQWNKWMQFWKQNVLVDKKEQFFSRCSASTLKTNHSVLKRYVAKLRLQRLETRILFVMKLRFLFTF